MLSAGTKAKEPPTAGAGLSASLTGSVSVASGAHFRGKQRSVRSTSKTCTLRALASSPTRMEEKRARREVLGGCHAIASKRPHVPRPQSGAGVPGVRHKMGASPAANPRGTTTSAVPPAAASHSPSWLHAMCVTPASKPPTQSSAFEGDDDDDLSPPSPLSVIVVAAGESSLYMRIVLSRQPIAAQRPSGETATQRTADAPRLSGGGAS